jgi:hypothetical protein
MTRLGALTLVALVLALALAACGGDDDDGGDTTSGSVPTTTEEARTATEETETAAEDDGEERGDDESNDERSEPRAPSLAEYVRSADRICRDARSAIVRRSAEYRKVTIAVARGKIKPQEYYRRGGKLTEQTGEIALRAVADLKELPRPRSRREAVEAYLASAATQATTLTEQGEALQHGRNKAVTKLNRRAAQASQETRRAAQRVGFRVCGGGS